MDRVDWFTVVATIGFFVLLNELRKLRHSQAKVPELLWAATPAIQGSRTRWRYRTVIPNWNPRELRFVFWVNGELDEDLARNMRGKDSYFLLLDEMGREGWELVSVASDPEGVAKVFYFKQADQRA